MRVNHSIFYACILFFLAPQNSFADGDPKQSTPAVRGVEIFTPQDNQTIVPESKEGITGNNGADLDVKEASQSVPPNTSCIAIADRAPDLTLSSDDRSFDSNLKKLLEDTKHGSSILIQLDQPVTNGQIPKELSPWFGKLEESGGLVETEQIDCPEIKTRGFFGFLKTLLSGFTQSGERYAAIRGFSAKLYYDIKEEKTRQVLLYKNSSSAS